MVAFERARARPLNPTHDVDLYVPVEGRSRSTRRVLPLPKNSELVLGRLLLVRLKIEVGLELERLAPILQRLLEGDGKAIRLDFHAVGGFGLLESFEVSHDSVVGRLLSEKEGKEGGR